MSQELLNTAEAARFLRVSQASIRRWSDAGLLSSHRVGRRRERRFAESDLVEFLNRSEKQSVAAKPETAIHVGGVAIPVPGHLATFYSTDPGRMRLTVPFLADGLRLRQPCFLVATHDVLEAFMKALENQAGSDLERAAASGRHLPVRRPRVRRCRHAPRAEGPSGPLRAAFGRVLQLNGLLRRHNNLI